nr:carbon-nitrogen hydrolase family protein [uncultured Aminipila sp.]
MNTIRIAQLQTQVVPEKNQILKYISSFIDKVCSQGIDLITLPEMFTCPYNTSSFPIFAEKEKGEIWSICSALSKQYRIYLSAGSIPEKDDEGNVYNTAYVFNPQGEQIAKHRKMHLFDIDIKNGQSFKESDTLTAGNQPTVFDTEFCKIGLCICYDFRFPELSRIMVDKGAKIILVPAAFNMTTGPAHWEIMFRSRAIDNQVYVAGTAPARNLSSKYISWGHSIIVSPWGDILNQMDEKEGYTIQELNLDVVEQVRSQLPLLAHRRSDVYSLSQIL